MATYDLDEQEKLAELKAWWQQYGNLIITVVTVALLIIGGMRWWNAYNRSQALEAGAVYAELLKAVEQADGQKVGDLNALVREEYPRTVYAPLAGLVAAKHYVEQEDGAAARAILEWVVDKARDAQLQAIARLRLAYVLLDEQAYEEALQVLDAKHPDSFTAQFAEARGDVQAVQGRTAEARSAYEAALAATPPSENTVRELLQLKLETLGAA